MLPSKAFAEDTNVSNNFLNAKLNSGGSKEQTPQEQVAEMMQQIDQEHDSEDEGIEDYKIGGYHPIHIGESLMKRYVIIQKLGWGHFSTVWLAKDFKYDTYVALKIQRSASHYLEAAYDEVEILQKVARNVNHPEWIQSLKEYYKEEGRTSFNRDDTHTVQLLNSFIFKGPYGNHFCFVFEILGVNLLEVIKRYNYRGVPMNVCRKIAKQCLIGLDFLHRICGVIHTDLKPENVLLCLSDDEIRDIVENGQLTKNQIFQERVEYFQSILKIPNTGPSKQQEVEIKSTQLQQQETNEDDSVDCDIDTTGMTKTQKKNLKRKKQKQKKKKADGLNNHNTNSINGKEEQVISQKQAKDILHQGNNEKIQFNSSTELPEDFKIKIADLGNACWIHHHFSTLIQTRQYRSPEVLIGSKYNPTADLWSFACMIFEMLTGDFLFEPRKGPTFSKNDDHLAQIQELLGRFPVEYSQRGLKASVLNHNNRQRYFDKGGSLLRIPALHYWSLINVLVEKYRFKLDEAEPFRLFLMPMLHTQPEHRTTAQQVLQRELDKDYEIQINPRNIAKRSGWLRQVTKLDHRMSEEEFKEYQSSKHFDEEDQKRQTRLDVEAEQQILPQTKPEKIRADTNEYEGSRSTTPHNPQTPQLLTKGGPRRIEHQLIDRSYTDLGYIGYGEGIDLKQLDSTGNWQFS